MKPFRAQAWWIEYAHCDAADEGQELAAELCRRCANASVVCLDSPALVAEVVSVAELYWPADRAIPAHFARYAGSVIKRGRKWLKDFYTDS